MSIIELDDAKKIYLTKYSEMHNSMQVTHKAILLTDLVPCRKSITNPAKKTNIPFPKENVAIIARTMETIKFRLPFLLRKNSEENTRKNSKILFMVIIPQSVIPCCGMNKSKITGEKESRSFWR